MVMTSSRVWYHGTTSVFDSFDETFIGKGNDQNGSGFYFTDEIETAKRYAGPGGEVLVAELRIGNPMPAGGEISRTAIAALLRSSPNFLDRLEDFGEVSEEGEATVLRRAVEAYAAFADGEADPLQCLNAISNDFWRGNEATFLRCVVRETGYDGLVREVGDEIHAVAWSIESIAVIERLAMVPLPQP